MDNLIKRNWTGCSKCVFCDEDETVDQLFISSHFARHVWRLIHFTFSIAPPSSVTNMFGHWLDGIDRKTKARIQIGTCAFVWAIWNCRNDVVFNKSRCAHFLQVVHRATYWIHMWSFLLPLEQRELMSTGCSRLMAVVRVICSQGG